MLKNLLLFFRIVDEIYTSAPIVRGEKSVKDPVKPKETSIPEENPVTASKLKIMPVSTKKITKLEEHTKDYKEYCLEKTSNQHMMKTEIKTGYREPIIMKYMKWKMKSSDCLYGEENDSLML